MKRRIGKIVLFFSIMAFLSAAGIVVFNLWGEYRAAQASQNITRQIRKLDVQPMAAAQLIEIDGEYYIGILSIPALSLELPVNNTLDYDRLEESPCRYTGDFSGSLVISAHNFEHHFRGISTLSYGDMAIITDAAGREHEYRVELMETLSESDVDAMVNSPYDLTLFTCTPGRTERVTVRFTRVQEEAAGNAPRAPNYRINYRTETIRLRKGALYSTDGVDFTEVTEEKGITLDVSDCITYGISIHIKRAATEKRPASHPQIIVPLARADDT